MAYLNHKTKIQLIFPCFIENTIKKWTPLKKKQLSIVLFINHCLLRLTFFYLLTMKDVLLFVWNTNTFTCVPDSTSNLLNEPSTLLQSLIVNLSENVPRLFHVSSQLYSYFLFYITLNLSERNILMSAIWTSLPMTHSSVHNSCSHYYRKTALET